MEFSTRKNGIRLLLLLAVVIGASAVVQDLHFDNTLASTRAAVFGVDGELGAMNVKLSDFRSAQVGYLANGQDPAYWMKRSSAIAEDFTSNLARLRASALASETAARLDGAATAFASLVDADTRARQALADEQHSLASEAIFTDSSTASQRVVSELAGARAAESDATERDMTTIGQMRLAVTGGAIASVLVLALFALQLGKPQASAAASMAQMLRDLPPPVKAPVATPPGATAVKSAPVTPSPAPVSSLNLPEAAELCGDLARVIDGRDVPGLLARAAKLLEATGVIVWMADSDGRRLQPMLTHGYSDKVLSRLGTLAVDADNVTSLAYRSRRSQQVNGAGSAGAIAIPLVTASGCTGVLAAEVKEAKLAPDAIALARIIAAQFATVIAPVEEVTQTQAAEA